jgi:transcription antitermination factor NusG
LWIQGHTLQLVANTQPHQVVARKLRTRHALPLVFVHLIEKILKHEYEFFRKLKQGDSVVIHSGPFAEYNAIFKIGLLGKDRLRVLLNRLGGGSCLWSWMRPRYVI